MPTTAAPTTPTPPATPASPRPAESESKRIRFTAPVRRGLALVRSVLIDAMEADTATALMRLRQEQVAWKAAQTRDFNAAMAWLEQVEADDAAPTEGGAA